MKKNKLLLLGYVLLALIPIKTVSRECRASCAVPRVVRCEDACGQCCGKLKKTHCRVRRLCVSIPARGSVPAARIFVKIQGEARHGKPPIVFVPGTCETSDTWACQQEELCKEFMTISFDSRGTGRSSRTSPALVRYTYELLADDLHAVLRKLGVEKFMYVGHSIGANIGVVYVNRFPDQITKLVLVSGDPFLVTPDCSVSKRCTVPACPACWPFPLTTASGVRQIEAQIASIGYPRFVSNLVKTQFYNERCRSALVNAQNLEIEQFIRSGLAIFNSVVFNMWTEDIRSLLPSIRVPTLICVGSIDAVVPTGASFFMHKKIHHSKLAEFVGKGHNLMVTDYQNFTRLVAKFANDCHFPRSIKVLGPCCVCPLAKPANFSRTACA